MIQIEFQILYNLPIFPKQIISLSITTPLPQYSNIPLFPSSRYSILPPIPLFSLYPYTLIPLYPISQITARWFQNNSIFYSKQPHVLSKTTACSGMKMEERRSKIENHTKGMVKRSNGILSIGHSIICCQKSHEAWDIEYGIWRLNLIPLIPYSLSHPSLFPFLLNGFVVNGHQHFVVAFRGIFMFVFLSGIASHLRHFFGVIPGP